MQYCTFINNSAFPTEELFRSANDIFSNFVLTGRGGALGFGLNQLVDGQRIEIIISNCVFLRNGAANFGGGMYFLFGPNANHRLLADRNKFTENEALNTGGGLFTGFTTVGIEDRFIVCHVTNSEFYRNSALSGGAGAWPVPGNSKLATTIAMVTFILWLYHVLIHVCTCM